ncbi:Carboxylesterase NlhH [Colletotrichum siamense]|nr:Carboxylesterase NlhH [Colletotrichum siamense]
MSLSTLHYDPEFAAVLAGVNIPPPPTTFKDVFELREWGDSLLEGLGFGMPIPENILQTIIPFESHDGTLLNITHFSNSNKPKNCTQQPAVLYVHGGGMVAGSVELYAPNIANAVDFYGLDFFAVDYRLAPEQPGPKLTEDVYYGLKYLSDHAKEYHVDNKRIAIMGDSAGGGLAAGAALLARDRALSPPIAKQVLIYPMLDDRTRLPENSAYTQFLLWTENANQLGWSSVLGEGVAGNPKANASIYAAPGRAKNLRGLPPTYIDVGQLDLFMFEDIAYANKLAEAEVEVELHILPGLPHAFEFASNATLVKQALQSRQRALTQV